MLSDLFKKLTHIPLILPPVETLREQSTFAGHRESAAREEMNNDSFTP